MSFGRLYAGRLRPGFDPEVGSRRRGRLAGAGYLRPSASRSPDAPAAGLTSGHSSRRARSLEPVEAPGVRLHRPTRLIPITFRSQTPSTTPPSFLSTPADTGVSP